MADTLALINLYNGVVALYSAEGTNVPNHFGWRKPAQAQHDTPGNRIVWYPGDPRGQLGKVGPARNPGQNPRSLATLNELFTVEISGCDLTSLVDETKQYIATRFLFDAWFRAVYKLARGTFAIESSEWEIDKKEGRFGATIRVVCTIQSKVPDKEFISAPVDTNAEVAIQELNITETHIFEAEP